MYALMAKVEELNFAMPVVYDLAQQMYPFSLEFGRPNKFLFCLNEVQGESVC